MEVVVLGINHETAPVALREKVAFRAEAIPESLGGLIRRTGVQEGMIVSTCNRVELYAAAATREAGISALEDFLCGTHGLDVRELRAHLYSHSGTPALKHIFRVCSSLDSLILGEPQILKQVKEAYQVALSTRAAGGVLNRVLHAAFRVAKRVRTETGIAAHAVSVSYAAVELAKKIFGELHGQTVLLIGAGEMGELAAKHLQKHGAAEILVANRTWEKAVALAGEFNGTAVQFEKLASWLPRADIVISAAAVGSDYLVTRPMVHDAIRARKHRPVFLIDIAVPRTIAPDVNGMGDVYLYGIDDLRGVVEENKAERRREAERAELIVDQEAAAFAETLAKIDLGPTIARLTRTFEAIRRGELERAGHSYQALGSEERDVVERITRAIVNKIAHEPILALKDGVLDPDTLTKVFGLADLEELPEPLDAAESQDPPAGAAASSGEKKSG
ncbi:MAG TPA: glutamyl-tRNA reductase [bacterium]|nr:glutamyl-tRNA reductase [bacterium]